MTPIETAMVGLVIYLCIGWFYVGYQVGLRVDAAKSELSNHPGMFIFGLCLASVAWPVCVLADHWGDA